MNSEKSRKKIRTFDGTRHKTSIGNLNPPTTITIEMNRRRRMNRALRI